MMLSGALMSREVDASVAGYEADVSVEEVLRLLSDLKVLCIIMFALACISILLRFFVRLRISKVFGAEDWTMVVVSLLFVAEGALILANIDISRRQFEGDSSDQLEILYTQISVGFFFLAIFSHRKIERWIIYVVMVLSTCCGIAYLPLGYGTCAQIKVLPGVNTTCPMVTQTAASATFAAFSIVTVVRDFTLTLLALIALYKVQLPLPTKLSACFLLVLGSVGGLASTVRLAIVLKKTDLSAYTKELFLLYRWVMVEIALGVIAANLALVRPLFHKLLSKMGAIGSSNMTKSNPQETHKYGARSSKAPGDGDELLLEEVKREVVITVGIASGGGPDSDKKSAAPRRTSAEEGIV
ncbi:Hypothetical protein D9617_24g017400 [Elsinoe fawcettii]|nr:Hypothetical protein D9617_24g017400 [Elsinoe fawcettii]